MLYAASQENLVGRWVIQDAGLWTFSGLIQPQGPSLCSRDSLHMSWDNPMNGTETALWVKQLQYAIDNMGQLADCLHGTGFTFLFSRVMPSRARYQNAKRRTQSVLTDKLLGGDYSCFSQLTQDFKKACSRKMISVKCNFQIK